VAHVITGKSSALMVPTGVKTSTLAGSMITGQTHPRKGTARRREANDAEHVTAGETALHAG
jgi:hypothetical protein